MSGARTALKKEAKARILLVDDHALVRHGLAALIGDEEDLEVCGEAADAPAALAQFEALAPDLLVVDLSLKLGHGLDLIRQITGRDAEARVLVLSMYDEAIFAERSLRAGALGYINKQEAPERVVEAIRRVLAGDVYLSPLMTQRMLRATRSGEGAQAAARLSSERLSDRELTVFQLIGQGLATREIAERLHLSVKTIETYREHIKAKLGLKNAAELGRHATQWALENG